MDVEDSECGAMTGDFTGMWHVVATPQIEVYLFEDGVEFAKQAIEGAQNIALSVIRALNSKRT